MSSPSSQIYESYVPVYDAVPEEWNKARPFFVEHLKKISEGINNREIGFFLDEQLLSGKQFISTSTNRNEFRSIFRKVVSCGSLTVGVNNIAHGINFNANFTLIDLWVAATNSTGLTAQVITDNKVTMDSTNINITSSAAYDRSFAVVEYLLEA